MVNAWMKLAFLETFVGIHLIFYLKAAIIKHFKISETRVVVVSYPMEISMVVWKVAACC